MKSLDSSRAHDEYSEIPSFQSLPTATTLAHSSAKERQCFEWFRYRAAVKLPGLSMCAFWETIIFQVSLSELSVLHAVLSLSSLHEHGVRQEESYKAEMIPAAEDPFVLQQYCRAISCLRPRQAESEAFVQIMLITCVMFIYFDLLYGRFVTAQMHLKSGLSMLFESHKKFNAKDTARNTIDDEVIIALTRLQFQIELFNQTHKHRLACWQHPKEVRTPSSFHNVTQASRSLQEVLQEVLLLRQLSFNHSQACNREYEVHGDLVARQKHVKAVLARWLEVHQASETIVSTNRDTTFGYLLLLAYHTMAAIMLGTCLSPNDESVFDEYNDQFMIMLRQLINMWYIRGSLDPLLRRPSPPICMARSGIDPGWIPLLYFMALKCRVHRIRLHAIKFLEISSHREGFWDGKICLVVAHKVMQLEEQDHSKHGDVNDHFSLLDHPRPADLAKPTVPPSQRLSEIKVELPDELYGDLGLSYERCRRCKDYGAQSQREHLLLPSLPAGI